MTKLSPELQLSCAAMMNRKAIKKPNRPVVGDWIRKTVGNVGVGKVENVVNGIALVQMYEVNEAAASLCVGDFECIHLDCMEVTEEPKTIAAYKAISTAIWGKSK